MPIAGPKPDPRQPAQPDLAETHRAAQIGSWAGLHVKPDDGEPGVVAGCNRTESQRLPAFALLRLLRVVNPQTAPLAVQQAQGKASSIVLEAFGEHQTLQYVGVQRADRDGRAVHGHGPTVDVDP